MAEQQQQSPAEVDGSGSVPGGHPVWSSRWTFVLAATGSAVGLGNIWKFPYIAGENGGGAFVLVYLLCILLVGIPVMVAEVMLGRRGRQSPINTMRRLTTEAGLERHWHAIGWLGVTAGLMILSYYAVIAGWALNYIGKMASGAFQGASADQVAIIFADLLSDPEALILWQTVFMILTLLVVIGGVTRGLGVAVRVLMPVLFVLLLILLVFGIQRGDFAQAFSFLFSFNYEALTWAGVLEAMGHAFFTLSLGMGAIMAYGAYMPEHARIGRTVLAVGFLDTVVALVAGLAIFPIVFANPSIAPGAGPGLLFVSLPIAFGNMTGGLLFGSLFFVLVTLAAWSSAISLIEPAVAYLIESKKFTRITANLLLGGIAWVVGLGSVLSFNIWAEKQVAGFNFFEFMDFLTSSVMLPLTGLFIALFVGWMMRPETVRGELADESGRVFASWYWILRYVSPIAVGIIFVMGLYKTFS
ncbi:MAG: sodium-dependent transporter [Porticoccus sp.]|jgi:NSS family neurotransmitter:Na+ symporter|uniref:sodium-dependent transporter n=1 Tax=Porticoccus sp. TaxID=2024853 RepID=UPI0032969BC5|tara:strand:+ start:289767 stop:291176 length:1410 start_codon:yes stop_codon:yes gene_type:complete